MKVLIYLFVFSISLSAFSNDYRVQCRPWKESQKNFLLEAEVELAGGNYIDAWVDMTVFDGENAIHTIKSTFSYGAFFIDRLYGKQVYIFELKPAGGQTYKYDFLSLAANHPLPSGNSYLTYKGIEYQAECTTNAK